MILELMHAFMRETDEGLTLKQVFQVILFHFCIWKVEACFPNVYEKDNLELPF